MTNFRPKQIFKIAFLLLAIAFLAVVAKIKQNSSNTVISLLDTPSARADVPGGCATSDSGCFVDPDNVDGGCSGAEGCSAD